MLGDRALVEERTSRGIEARREKNRESLPFCYASLGGGLSAGAQRVEVNDAEDESILESSVILQRDPRLDSTEIVS